MSLVPETVEYGEDSKYGKAVGLFGEGYFWGVPKTNVPEEGILAHTLRLAYAHGCPRPNLVIETGGLVPAMHRYSEVNQTYYMKIRQEARSYNHTVYRDLRQHADRKDEGVGLHEATAVPESFKDSIAPMTRLEGYALPRLYILRAGTSSKDTYESFKRREDTDLLLRTNLTRSNSALELLAKFVRDLGNQPDLERADILHHALPTGVLEEENCLTTFNNLGQLLEQWAPEMANFYTQLTPTQLIEKQIAFVPYLKSR
jgi:hypothetical protein